MLLNFFDVLGLVFEDDYAWSEESYREIIKPSYKRMSREYHPDKNPGDSEAAEKFRWIAEANTVLSDENKANEYLTLLRIYRKIFPNHS
ncbi:hypothetical protein COV82_03595 [Candidatus Peregrinibacteria bacterium CG11_big_fil_rev_8_21_14_0_20_46_8]|nr:MAG: hypothetical protein COV82_03595 [Candidatus Peregrinibacteria bacterium CG11_big_fil_rev_8_21_14_0_20_46_8]